MKILLASTPVIYQQHAAFHLFGHNSLAEFWTSDKLIYPQIQTHHRRCWPFHLTAKLFYHAATMGQRDRMVPRLWPIWDAWALRQAKGLAGRSIDIVCSVMGSGCGPFGVAERIGALKVVDASSSHPTSFYGFWQRECDIWSPGARVTLPRSLFRRCTQDLERADYILCSSLFVRDSMLYNGIPESKLAVLPYGADTSTFKPAEDATGKPVFIAVGTLTLRKGTHYLLEAMRLVRRFHPDAQLYLVGGVHDDFKRLIRRWQGEFTHVPAASHAQLAGLLQESLAFVFPSCEEGFARVLSEAMAAGLPIVATHESGASTVVKDGEQGFIVPQRQPQALADRLVQLIEDPQLARRMGMLASSFATSHGSHEAYGQKLTTIFHDWIRQHQRHAGTPGGNLFQ
jgi:glycosyltransferase involved in cell wall biosynthesis